MNGTRVMNPNSIPHWEISGFVEYIGSGQQQDDMILPVPEGARAVRLGNDATIRQLLSVTRKKTYSITFSAARTCAQAEKLNVSVGPESGVLPIQTVYTSSGWDSYSYAFRARHSTAWLTIHNPGVEEDPACGPLIDLIAIKTLSPPRRERGDNLVEKRSNIVQNKTSSGFRESGYGLSRVLAGNMLRNEDFEEGPFIFPDTAWDALVPPLDEDDVSPLPGWTVMSDTKVVKYVDAAHHAVPRGAEPGGHLEPGPAAEARAVDEHDVLAAAAHGEKGYGTVLLAARDVGSNARSPLVRLQPRLGAQENL